MILFYANLCWICFIILNINQYIFYLFIITAGSAPPGVTAAIPGGGGPPPPGANRFSRPKGRGARNQYVDVLNPGGLKTVATAPSSLFNVMPTTTAAPANFFIPQSSKCFYAKRKTPVQKLKRMQL